MKITIGIESFEQMRDRKLVRARRLVNSEPMEPEMRTNFENPLDSWPALHRSVSVYAR